MKGLWQREPAVILGLLDALVVLGAAFGLELSGAQVGAVAGFVTAVQVFVTHQVVTSPATAAGIEYQGQRVKGDGQGNS